MILFHHHFKIFDCLCYRYNPSIQHKIDACASPGIFVRYHFKYHLVFDTRISPGIFNLYSNKIYVSRNVTFLNLFFSLKYSLLSLDISTTIILLSIHNQDLAYSFDIFQVPYYISSIQGISTF